MNPNGDLEEVGIREGEKLHELMIPCDEARNTYEYDDHYIIYPQFTWWNVKGYFKEGGTRVKDGFEYQSGTNKEWLNLDELKIALEKI